jgi:hypothetical protein
MLNLVPFVQRRNMQAAKVSQVCDVWDPATQQSRPARLEYSVSTDERGMERHFLLELTYLNSAERPQSAAVFELELSKAPKQSPASVVAIA